MVYHRRMEPEHHLLLEGVLAFVMLVREAVWSLRVMRLRSTTAALQELQREVDRVLDASDPSSDALEELKREIAESGGLGAEPPGAAAPRPEECPRCGWVDRPRRVQPPTPR